MADEVTKKWTGADMADEVTKKWTGADMADEVTKQATESEEKTLKIDDYEFKVDTDLLDDVEAFELIDRIENKSQVGAIVPLLEFLIGAEGYQNMKNHFIKTEGRFRMTKLSEVYKVIIENFNPKDSR